MKSANNRKRVVVVVNKWWECDPVMFALTNDYVRPQALNWPEILHYPCRKHTFFEEPRAVFNMEHTTAEIWCISDLLAQYKDIPCMQSSSEKKMIVLPGIFSHPHQPADLVIAAGTAAFYPDSISNNGSAVIGSKVFLHNGHPDEQNSCSKWQAGPFDEIIGSTLSTDDFKTLTDFSGFSPALPGYFLVEKIDSAVSLGIYANHDYVACNSINVTDYTEYEQKDLETMRSYMERYPDRNCRSLETTHGLIKIAAGTNTPFMFVSGIVDRYGCFDIDVPDPPYAQNTVGAHNAGVVIAHLLVNIDNLYSK
jgi:hypothetical protein